MIGGCFTVLEYMMTLSEHITFGGVSEWELSSFDWSIIAAFFSAVAALGSLFIAISQFNYLKNKESAILGLSSRFEEISLNYDSTQFEEIIESHYFVLQNLSVLQINLVELELGQDLNKNKKKFFQDADDNPAFITLGFPMQPVIKNFQEYFTSKLKFNYIRSDEVIKVELPSFILKEFIHASYKMRDGKPFSYNNYLIIKVKYFDKAKSKFQYQITKMPYEIKFMGARAVLHFNIEPAVIKLD